MYNILTPGPTKVAENVRMARALETTNPDLDPAFYEFYRVTCAKYSHFLNTANPSFILSGEGILAWRPPAPRSPSRATAYSCSITASTARALPIL